MTIREGVSSVADRLNNATFRDPRRKQEITSQLRERFNNAIADRPERGNPEVENSTQNLRQLANRVIESDLERGDKAKLLDRIKNAAGSNEGGGTPRVSNERAELEQAREAAYEAVGKRSLGRA